ncbi:ribbon-helix-helix protein, CopG family [Candidatus Bathyarchaeota archaeon]|nr:MAG: ribbon-helix-helix protein, CopG family [Candidatus Bathyarchaeota archaeon]
MVQVQVRMPEKLVKEIDRWVAEGRFKSRSDAIKTIATRRGNVQEGSMRCWLNGAGKPKRNLKP